MFGRDSMRVIPSSVRVGSEEFLGRQAAMKELITKLEAAQADACAGGGEKYTKRHQSRGKLLPRERIELLLDPGSHFLELMPLAGHTIRGVGTGGGVIGGIGVVEGVRTAVTAVAVLVDLVA